MSSPRPSTSYNTPTSICKFHTSDFDKRSLNLMKSNHCVKRVRIWSYFGSHFAAFGLNTEKYFVYLRIQSECGKIRTRISPNTDTFYGVSHMNRKQRWKLVNVFIQWSKTNSGIFHGWNVFTLSLLRKLYCVLTPILLRNIDIENVFIER